MVRDREISVAESCAKPTGGGVASVASSRIAGRDVIGNGTAKCLCAVPIGGVAAVAGRVRGGEAVIVVDVAQVAGCREVSAGESPTGGAVIEHAWLPSCCVVASGAKRSRESCGDVVGSPATQCGSAVPGRNVAAVAIGIGRGQIVVVVYVATGAGRADVRAGKGETGGVVIKIGGAPAESSVAVGTISESEGGASCRVRRIIGLLPGGEMASGGAASCRSNLQIVIT